MKIADRMPSLEAGDDISSDLPKRQSSISTTCARLEPSAVLDFLSVLSAQMTQMASRPRPEECRSKLSSTSVKLLSWHGPHILT